jgi:hypothetical protein
MIRTACAYLIFAALVCTGHAQRTATVAITEPGSGTLDNYMNRADVVALVKVVAGDTEAYGVPIYKAEVIQGFKGAVAGQTIFFGRFVGTRLGWEYVLFLRDVKNPLTPKPSATNAFGTIHYAEVFNEGYSSMETSYECKFGADNQCDYGVRVCTDYVTLPADTPVSPPMTETTDFGCRWVRKTTLLSLLHQRSSPK